MFHVSLLEKKVRNNVVVSSLLPRVDEHGGVEVVILDRKIEERQSSWGDGNGTICLKRMPRGKIWSHSLVNSLN